MIIIFIAYFILLNLTTFILFGIDKRKARKKKYRIPEQQLLWFAAMGGALGAWAGMRFFRHKTLHKKFSLGIPLILTTQCVTILYLIMRSFSDTV